MGKVLVPKVNKEEKHHSHEHHSHGHHKKHCSHGHHKRHFTILSILAVVFVSTSAMSWIAFMNIKQNGGKLPWE